MLTYLPTMFKAAEIAAGLFVTVNTRRGAVERARARELL